MVFKMLKKRYKYDWSEIQREYDRGSSYKDLMKKYGMSFAALVEASSRGDLNARTISEASRLAKIKYPYVTSSKTKKKLARIQRKFLRLHPEKMPYLVAHSFQESYPEKVFKMALHENRISGWMQYYQNGIYEYDFAFPELKIDVEIDGATHYSDRVKAIDKRRDMWSKSQGWRIIRFKAQKVKLHTTECIQELIKIIAEVEAAAGSHRS